MPHLGDCLSLVRDGLWEAGQANDPELESANRRVLEAGGKRLRPALTIAAAWLAEVFDARVVAAGVAVELVQVGSLVHDDLLDLAATRRGIPTINAVEGPTMPFWQGRFFWPVLAAGLLLRDSTWPPKWLENDAPAD